MAQLCYPVPTKHVRFEDEQPAKEANHHYFRAPHHHNHHHHRHQYVEPIIPCRYNNVQVCYEELVVKPVAKPHHHRHHYYYRHPHQEEVQPHHPRLPLRLPISIPAPTHQCASCRLTFATRSALSQHNQQLPKYCAQHLSCFSDWTRHCFDYDHMKCPRSACRNLAPFASRQKCLEHLRACHGR